MGRGSLSADVQVPVIDINLHKHYNVQKAASTFIQLQILQNLINVDDDQKEI